MWVSTDLIVESHIVARVIFERVVAHARPRKFLRRGAAYVPIIDRRDRFYLGYYSSHAPRSDTP